MEASSQSKPLRILIAEDDKDHQHLLLLSLLAQRPQADVRVVSTGAQLLETVRTERFDCVVLDFNLPDFKANELVGAAADHLSATPVVIVSSCQGQDVVIDCFRCGVVDFVPKGRALEGDNLWRSVEHAISESRRLIAERREQDRRESHLARLAETDQLTGLYNRRYFERCVADERWRNDRRKTVSVVMMDIDHFKRINDTHGHHAGDAALQQVGSFLVSQVGGSDIVVRWGGEEFLVLRPSASLMDTLIWADRLRRLIEHRGVRHDDRNLGLTVSVGVHECHASELDPDTIDCADRALYLAKARGRNQVCTSLMADMNQAVDQACDAAADPPPARLERFLQIVTPRLGPTQREHITDHAEQVATMARQIARVLGLPESAQQQVHTAGRLHDIGKCMVPEPLLAKPGRLSLAERAIVSLHCQFGAEIAERLGFDEQVTRCIREHHHRYDTLDHERDGDPREASLGPRILCATDALVTMLTCRTYQSPKSLVDALSELRREKHRQFDPDVVNAAHFIESLFSLAA